MGRNSSKVNNFSPEKCHREIERKKEMRIRAQGSLKVTFFLGSASFDDGSVGRSQVKWSDETSKVDGINFTRSIEVIDTEMQLCLLNLCRFQVSHFVWSVEQSKFKCDCDTSFHLKQTESENSLSRMRWTEYASVTLPSQEAKQSLLRQSWLNVRKVTLNNSSNCLHHRKRCSIALHFQMWEKAYASVFFLLSLSTPSHTWDTWFILVAFSTFTGATVRLISPTETDWC